MCRIRMLQAKARVSSSYGKLPISFELNQGQADGTVQFLARGMGYTLFLTPGEAVLSLRAVHARASRPRGMPSRLRQPRRTGRHHQYGVAIDRVE